MTIRVEPRKIGKRLAKQADKLIKPNLTVNKAALNAIASAGVAGKKGLEEIALSVIKDVKAEIKEEGSTREDALEENQRKLVQRVQNGVVQGITKKVKQKYRGEFYTWLPSTAKNPDEKHMKKYGKRFQLGRGEAPGDRYGCQCGLEIHVKESKLTLE